MPNPSLPMERLGFAFMAVPGSSAEAQALTLAASIRAFGAKFSDSPIWVLIPEAEDSVSEATRKKLASLDARLAPFGIDPATLKFPFAGKVFASAAAESLARGQADFLVWMDRGSIVISEPGQPCVAAARHLLLSLICRRIS